MLDIYKPIVETSTISFELRVPSVDEFSARVKSYGESHAWIVAEKQGAVLGYAYGLPHRSREAYRYSAETSVYVAPTSRGEGVGKRLYGDLFERLATGGYYQAFAGVTLPNEASEALHAAVGFQRIGTFPKVGFKFGEWCDVSWWSRSLRDDQPDGAS